MGEDMAALSPRTAAAPPAPQLVFVATGRVLLRPAVSHGRTPRGERFHVSIIGGHFAGPLLEAQVLPGGADWQLLRTDGVFELEAIYDLRCSDGTLVHVRNRALWHSPTDDWPADYAMSQPSFEAPDGPHAWLNRAQFVASIEAGPPGQESVCLRLFRLDMPAMEQDARA